MIDYDFVRPSGRYPNETVPGAADFRAFDVKQLSLLNDAVGGFWNPLTPIMIGGAGVSLPGAPSQSLGGARFRGSSQLVHGTSDTTQLSPARTRSIVMPLTEWDDLSSALSAVTAGGSTYPRLLEQCIQMQSSPAGMLLVGVVLASIAIPGRYLHHGDVSSLASISLSFRVLSRPSTVPGVLMAFGMQGFNTTTGGSPTPTPLPQSQSPWTASNAYTAGVYIIPNANVAAPLSYFKLTSASGTSGVAEPIWNLTPGGTTTDGPLTWTCIGPAGLFYAPTIDTYYKGGAPQVLTCAFDVGSGAGDTLDNSPYRYYAPLVNTPSDSSILYHSIKFNFVNIRSMAFE